MEKEIWKSIAGHYGRYEVSNFGRVKSIERKQADRIGRVQTINEHILKPQKFKGGYMLVHLSTGKSMKWELVHRLVAEAFVPNPEKLPQVNHKDENKENNTAENLEWVTTKDNANYGTRNERISKSKTNNPKNSKQVIQLDSYGREIAKFPSTQEAMRKTGVFSTSISACCNGHPKHRTAGGYTWRYAETEAL